MLSLVEITSRHHWTAASYCLGVISSAFAILLAIYNEAAVGDLRCQANRARPNHLGPNGLKAKFGFGKQSAGAFS